MNKITISALIKSDIEKVWDVWNNEKHIVNLQNQSREWVVNKHSYQAIGNRLKTLLNL